MDSRDLRIVARISREPLAPITALADEAGLTPNATRARVDRLRAQGVLMGVFAFPNPALLGRATRIAVYAPPPRKVALARVLGVDEVLSASVNHDGQVAVTYYARGPEDPPPAALDRLLGGPAPRVYRRESPPLRPPGAVLSTDQWRVVEAMLEDGRRSVRSIAEATGLSERVASRHRKRMLEGSHVTLVTGILSNLAEGVVLFHLYVEGPGTRDEAAVVRALGPALVQERTRDPDGLYVFCHADSLGDALLAQRRAADLPGVHHVELVLEREAEVATERIRTLCRARREAGLAAPRGPNA